MPVTGKRRAAVERNRLSASHTPASIRSRSCVRPSRPWLSRASVERPSGLSSAQPSPAFTVRRPRPSRSARAWTSPRSPQGPSRFTVRRTQPPRSSGHGRPPRSPKAVTRERRKAVRASPRLAHSRLDPRGMVARLDRRMAVTRERRKATRPSGPSSLTAPRTWPSRSG
jgi:hypothetical protein